MGKVTKAVIEDIAYEFKRVGLAVHAVKNGIHIEDDWDDRQQEEGCKDPEYVLDWMIENVADILATHDPTFQGDKFRQQTQYKN